MGEFRRFFAESSERVGNSVILVKEYNHIAKVLRARVGDEVIVNFNDGVDNHCIVNAISDKSVTLTIVSSCVNE
ncbi:MAG: RNA methyltransferase PUA domain-containing protein, partial [Clostridia bacterium]